MSDNIPWRGWREAWYVFWWIIFLGLGMAWTNWRHDPLSWREAWSAGWLSFWSARWAYALDEEWRAGRAETGMLT